MTPKAAEETRKTKTAAPRTRSARAPKPEKKQGLPLGLRFALSMSLAIAGVMILGGFILYAVSANSLREGQIVSGVSSARNLAAWPLPFVPDGKEERRGQTAVLPVKYKVEGVEKRGILYSQMREDSEGRGVGQADILVPEETVERVQADLTLILIIITVVLVAATSIVAWLVGKKVTAPLIHLIDDIEIISKGDLAHKTRVREGGEMGQLAEAVDRMTSGLKAAQETEMELQKRQHDLAVASEVRQNLLPDKIAQVTGYEIAGIHKASAEVGGDYYDVIPIEGTKKVALLVAEVAGKGIPAALVMTMARAYLRSELLRHPSPAAAFAAANRALTRDMRRGMYVTAICAVLDPEAGTATVVSAGHKVPLVHWAAAGDQLRVVTPPGIALGFDPGPVFERTLKENAVTIAAGDRLVLASSGPFAAKNQKGEELGEKGFYSLVKHEASKNSDAFLNRILYGIEKFQDGEALSSDVAVATLKKL